MALIDLSDIRRETHCNTTFMEFGDLRRPLVSVVVDSILEEERLAMESLSLFLAALTAADDVREIVWRALDELEKAGIVNDDLPTCFA